MEGNTGFTNKPFISKHWGHHHHHHGFHGGYRGYRVYAGYDSCLRTRWVMNRFGTMVLRTYNLCY